MDMGQRSVDRERYGRDVQHRVTASAHFKILSLYRHPIEMVEVNFDLHFGKVALLLRGQ